MSERSTRENISRYAMAPEDDLRRRMRHLDREWDVERAISFDAAAVMLAGLAMGSLIHRVFYGLTGVAAGMLLAHTARSCECPPRSMLVKAGFRLRQDIDHEKAELEQAMRARMQAEQEAKGRTGVRAYPGGAGPEGTGPGILDPGKMHDL